MGNTEWAWMGKNNPPGEGTLSYKDSKTNIVHGGLILGPLPFVPSKNLYKNNWIYWHAGIYFLECCTDKEYHTRKKKKTPDILYTQ